MGPFLEMLAVDLAFHSLFSTSDCDVISKEAYDVGIVFYATFCLGDVEPEGFFQESFNFPVDFFGFTFRANSTQQEVVCIPAVTQSPIFWVMLVTAWHFQHLSLQILPCFKQRASYLWVFLLLDLFTEDACSLCNCHIWAIVAPLLSLAEFRDERFNVAVEFVKVDVCQYWRDDTPLWRAAICVVELPVFHISGFEHLSDDIEEFDVINFLFHQSHKNISPPYTFFLLNGDMELNRDRELFV